MVPYTFCLHFKIHNFALLLPFSGSQKGGTYKITRQPRLVTWYNSCRHTAEKRKGKKVNSTNFLALILHQEWFYTFLHTPVWCLNRCTPVCFYTSDSSIVSKHMYHCTHVEMRFEYTTGAVKSWLHQKYQPSFDSCQCSQPLSTELCVTNLLPLLLNLIRIHFKRETQ